VQDNHSKTASWHYELVPLAGNGWCSSCGVHVKCSRVWCRSMYTWIPKGIRVHFKHVRMSGHIRLCIAHWFKHDCNFHGGSCRAPLHTHLTLIKRRLLKFTWCACKHTTHTHTHTKMHTPIHTPTHTRSHVHTYTRTHTHTYTRTLAHTHTHTRTHTHTHTHTHTQTVGKTNVL